MANGQDALPAEASTLFKSPQTSVKMFEQMASNLHGLCWDMVY
jgi:hypothetical protein